MTATRTVFPLVMKAVNLEKRHVHCPFIGNADEEIEDAVEIILDSYSLYIQDKLKRVDYSLAQFRCAYAYLYLASHIQMLRKFYGEMLDLENQHIRTWFEDKKSRGKVNVCSVGGGPGTDLCGFILYLKDMFCSVTLECSVLDLYIEWKSIADKITPLFDPEYFYLKKRNIGYHKFDFFQPINISLQETIRNADLVPMVKFVSAIMGKNSSKEKLQSIFTSMKPGSLLFFLDNERSKCYDYMNEIIPKSHFLLIKEIKHIFCEISDQEINEMKPCYKELYGYFPQLNTHVTISLWQKKANPVEMPTLANEGETVLENERHSNPTLDKITMIDYPTTFSKLFLLLGFITSLMLTIFIIKLHKAPFV